MGQPFTVAEDPRFRLALARLKPNAGVPSADTIKWEIMGRYHRKEAFRVGEMLRSVDSKISLTADCWTSPNGLAFFGVTAHYIDDQWVPHDLVLWT